MANGNLGGTGGALTVSRSAFVQLVGRVNVLELQGRKKGTTGSAGPTGPTGATGATGATGPQGPPGIAFAVATHTIGDSPLAVPIGMQVELCSSSAGADFVANLPSGASSTVGDIKVFKKMDANAHNIVINPNGTDTIDGANNATLSTITLQYDSFRLMYAGSGAWVIW